MRTRNAIILRVRTNRIKLEWMRIKLIRYNTTLRDEEVALVWLNLVKASIFHLVIISFCNFVHFSSGPS